MADRSRERRSQPRCAKTVHMHCAYLHGRSEHMVTLLNFNSGGLYFESGRNLATGTYVVLRAMTDDREKAPTVSSPAIATVDNEATFEACNAYRSHTVVKVLRCRRLDGVNDTPRYGVGAAIQMLADG